MKCIYRLNITHIKTLENFDIIPSSSPCRYSADFWNVSRHSCTTSGGGGSFTSSATSTSNRFYKNKTNPDQLLCYPELFFFVIAFKNWSSCLVTHKQSYISQKYLELWVHLRKKSNILKGDFFMNCLQINSKFKTITAPRFLVQMPIQDKVWLSSYINLL